ncbi:hypothetical protein JDV02_000625 [Purpureocillium takamizusanense]|uniref:BTB domain-containing protein n=1 Tax=Purpureocillium takamizusanense TaxID=2060973 RepID=A0A9Q8Q7K4_9HYPO|nr:uncharacterized protein JDV02_000625 [Purpureocillium takamizusanense]UNI13936.1 hypothetical protein JDV02_000625 [Purpureocillium takamizusanense]
MPRHDDNAQDDTSTNPGADVDMAEEASTAAHPEEETADNGADVSMAVEETAPPARTSFTSYLQSPIVNLLVGQGDKQTLLSAHQALLVQSPYFEAACQGFVDDGSVSRRHPPSSSHFP